MAARFQELYEGTQGRGSKAALKTRIFRTLVKAHGATFARAGLLKVSVGTGARAGLRSLTGTRTASSWCTTR